MPNTASCFRLLSNAVGSGIAPRLSPSTKRRLKLETIAGRSWITSKVHSVSAVQRPASSHARNQHHDEHDEKNAEQELRDGSGAGSQAAEAKNRGNYRHH